MSTSIFVLAADQQAVKRAALADQGATSRAIGDDRMEVDGSALQSTSGDRLLACPGDLLTDDAQFMRGHGTFVEDETLLYASVAGIVERVNKLVSVHPQRARYQPEVGDVIVGRVLDVGPKRWRVDVNAKLDGVLLLSSVNLPGGVQRRKQESDALQMRSFFAEGDMVVVWRGGGVQVMICPRYMFDRGDLQAEVQQFFGDGALSMHTRSLKYGKLRNGVLFVVPPALIKRSKSHFHTLPGLDVDVILGLNGMIWVSKHTKELTMEEAEANPDALYTNANEDTPLGTRDNIARVCNCLRAMRAHAMPIHERSLMAVYEESLAHATRDLLQYGVAVDIVRRAAHAGGVDEQ